jgi:rhodanese-related sulfurtransferase
MAEALRITVDELRRRMQAGEDFTFLDVRNPKAWAESAVTIPGAIHVSLENFEQHLPPVPKERNIITYCT